LEPTVIDTPLRTTEAGELPEAASPPHPSAPITLDGAPKSPRVRNRRRARLPRERRIRLRGLIYGLSGFAVAVLLWELLNVYVVDSAVFPGPWEVLAAFVVAVGSVSFWQATAVTLLMALKGLILAMIVGIPLGLAIGLSPLLASATRVPLEFIKPIPPIVIMPTAIMVLGPTQQMGEFLIFFGCFVPILYQTANGVREVDPVAVDTARAYGMKRPEIIARIVVPSASAFIGTAIRIAMPISLMVAVVAGLLGGSPGLGKELTRSVTAGDEPYMYALVIVLGIMGLAVSGAGELIERRVLRWHPSFRAEEMP
jgi:ABC-type nitrate/sulfonate/bicarbonate transport system permease component